MSRRGRPSSRRDSICRPGMSSTRWGPVISGAVRPEDRRALAGCYASCLALAAERGLSTVAFCCISTGEYRFPNRAAAEIAVDTVTSFLAGQTSIQRVIFNVFKDTDRDIYRELLGGA